MLWLIFFSLSIPSVFFAFSWRLFARDFIFCACRQSLGEHRKWDPRWHASIGRRGDPCLSAVFECAKSLECRLRRESLAARRVISTNGFRWMSKGKSRWSSSWTRDWEQVILRSFQCDRVKFRLRNESLLHPFDTWLQQMKINSFSSVFLRWQSSRSFQHLSSHTSRENFIRALLHSRNLISVVKERESARISIPFTTNSFWK